MHKKYWYLFLILLCGACSSSGLYNGETGGCPPVSIVKDRSRQVQLVNYRDEFAIELTGYDVFCYNVSHIRRRVAVVTPHFRIKRLHPSDVTRVDFSFYTDPVEGPPAFLGKKSYSASVEIAENEADKQFSGPPAKVRVPYEGYENFTIYLGIDLTRAEYNYNQRAFDFEPSSLPDEPGKDEPEIIERTVYIEEGYNQPIIIEQRPKKSSCSSCSL